MHPDQNYSGPGLQIGSILWNQRCHIILPDDRSQKTLLKRFASGDLMKNAQCVCEFIN
jgi:hypothetical protein